MAGWFAVGFLAVTALRVGDPFYRGKVRRTFLTEHQKKVEASR